MSLPALVLINSAGVMTIITGRGCTERLGRGKGGDKVFSQHPTVTAYEKIGKKVNESCTKRDNTGIYR